MTSILVPNATIGPKSGWTSITDTVTKEEEIALKFNERHLMSSNISPFAYGPLSDLIGNDARNSHPLTQGLTVCSVPYSRGRIAKQERVSPPPYSSIPALLGTYDTILYCPPRYDML